MDRLRWIALGVCGFMLLVVLQGCGYVRENTGTSESTGGTLYFTMQTLPTDIVRVTVKAEHGSSIFFKDLTVDTENRVATGTLGPIGTGVWNISATAYNASQVILYRGIKSDVLVQEGSNTVALEMQRVNGDLVLEVTWPDEDTPSAAYDVAGYVTNSDDAPLSATITFSDGAGLEVATSVSTNSATGYWSKTGLVGAVYVKATASCHLFGAAQLVEGNNSDVNFIGTSQASPEICNDQDDDCDGQVDEDSVCDPCANFVCNDPPGPCYNSVGTVSFNGEVCMCEYTMLNSGTPCNDGNACTTSDICQIGVCQGTPVICDDGDPNTTDTCSSATGACAYVPH